MGLYDTIVLDADVELPGFPSALDASALRWQTKSLGHPAMRTFRLSAEGRLLRKEYEFREKTPAEKEAEAAEHGFDAWAEYAGTVEYLDLGERLDRGYPVTIDEQTHCDEWWADHNQHGSFEFHTSSPDESEFDVFWSYEARFSRGNLDGIVFLGDRHGAAPDELDLPTDASGTG